jgi:hypothetical protein
MDFSTAFNLHKRMNMLQFIRRNLLANKAKVFEQSAQQLELCQNYIKFRPDWSRKEDKILLKLVGSMGFDCDF